MEKITTKDKFKDVIDYLDSTEDGEAGEEPHGASYQAQLSVDLYPLISLDLIKRCRAEKYLDNLKL